MSTHFSQLVDYEELKVGKIAEGFMLRLKHLVDTERLLNGEEEL